MKKLLVAAPVAALLLAISTVGASAASSGVRPSGNVITNNDVTYTFGTTTIEIFDHSLVKPDGGSVVTSGEIIMTPTSCFAFGGTTVTTPSGHTHFEPLTCP